MRELRLDYWHQVKNVAPNDLVFLDEMGVLLGLTRSCARSHHGTIVYHFQPFYPEKVTVSGAISCQKVFAVMTLNGSMNGAEFQVFIEKLLLPQLWAGAVVVRDNLPLIR